MNALVLDSFQGSLKAELKTVPIPKPTKNQARVKILAAALNRRDLWCTQGLYPGLKYPSTLGSDGCGVVEEVFDENNKNWIGKHVIINPTINWGNDEKVQSNDFNILGMPTDGTLAENVIVSVDRLHLKPDWMTVEQAASLPLAGLTAYRALFVQGGFKKGDNVLVTGIGGGVAQFLAQFAVIGGANVYVTSGSEEKINRAKSVLGIKYGANYNHQGWEKELISHCPSRFDLIVDGTGGDQFNVLLRTLAKGGTLVTYGATARIPKNLDLPRIFLSQLKIVGSTMGSDQDFVAMLDFINRHKMIPVVSSVRPFHEVLSAFGEMERSQQFGKLVLSFVPSKL